MRSRPAQPRPRRSASTAGSARATAWWRALIGGVLGGVGLGWFFDHLAHTSPIGLIGGLLIGTVVSIVGAVASASRMSARMTAQTGPVPPASADEDDE